MGGIGRRQKMRYLYRMHHVEEADETSLRDVKAEIEREIAWHETWVWLEAPPARQAAARGHKRVTGRRRGLWSRVP